MKRKFSLAFMATALALGACSNAVGPNANRSNPSDPTSEQTGKEEYYDPSMPTPQSGTPRSSPSATSSPRSCRRTWPSSR